MSKQSEGAPVSERASDESRAKNKTRINFNVPQQLIERFDEERRKNGIGSISSALHDAMRLYISACRAHERGEQLVFKSKDGYERPIDVKAGIY